MIKNYSTTMTVFAGDTEWTSQLFNGNGGPKSVGPFTASDYMTIRKAASNISTLHINLDLES